MRNKILAGVVSVLAAIGLVDATILTRDHYAKVIPICSLTHGCDKVLTSRYATIGHVPLALIGIIYYAVLLILSLDAAGSKVARKLLLITTSTALLVSLYLAYLQFYVLKAICQYCLASGIVTVLAFSISAILVLINKAKEAKREHES